MSSSSVSYFPKKEYVSIIKGFGEVMMKNCDSFSNNTYFAAANGYGGFRSYFDLIFKSESYEKIFVLKGGPGTGKSSLIASVLKHFYELGCNTDAILCSSDTDSLDGAIVERNGHRIALLDGTAPHERDTRVPGAIDVLINLGENWNENELEKKRGEILILREKKQKYYKNAYNYLRISGFCATENREIYKRHFDFQKAEKSVEPIIKALSSEGGEKYSLRLNEAFGKNGTERLETNFKKSVLSIGGYSENAYLFMSILLRKLKEASIGFIEYPTALSESRTSIIETKTLVIKVGADKYEICADDFSSSFTDEEKILSEHFLTDAMQFRRLATVNFKNASESHFMLEEIYKSCMDFSKNDKILKKIISSAERFLL